MSYRTIRIDYPPGSGSPKLEAHGSPTESFHACQRLCIGTITNSRPFAWRSPMPSPARSEKRMAPAADAAGNNKEASNVFN
jgi:hypothetical protein